MMTLDWFGLHGGSWGQEICPESYSHPAKFSRALIRRIYEHAIERGWLVKGDAVLDPLAGVALGGLDAMFHGLDWVGVELEEKFVGLGQQNIDLWNSRYNNGMLPRWGTAVLLQGDSRDLLAVLGGARAAACVSSPPYAGNYKSDYTHERRDERRLGIGFKGRGRGCFRGSENYSDDSRNLGNMREGSHEEAVRAVVSSPPFAGGCAHTGGDDPKPEHIEGGELRFVKYSQSAGQLAAMATGDVDAVISSPPYANRRPEASGGGVDLEKQYETYRAQGGGASFEKFCRTQRLHSQDYGQSPGQLAAMPEGRFEASAVVSSPPFEQTQGFHDKEFSDQWGSKQLRTGTPMGYGESPDNLGNEQGATFWTAARVIVEQCWLALAPGGHAIWVLKAFVRNKAIVDFPDQWRRMCEACGFETVEWIRAWLVEDRGAQWTLDGELVEKEVRRESFFRRLHRQKYPHLSIDFEVVLVMRKVEAV